MLTYPESDPTCDRENRANQDYNPRFDHEASLRDLAEIVCATFVD